MLPADAEIVEALQLAFHHVHMLHPSEFWATSAPINEFQQGSFWPFSLSIDTTIGQVFHESNEAELLCSLLRRCPIPDALYLSLDVNFEMFIHKRTVKLGRCFGRAGLHSLTFRRFVMLIFIM